MFVLADLRWPEGTGIGVVKREMLRRRPGSCEVIDLRVAGSVGSPFAPFAISKAIRKNKLQNCVFWSPGFMPPSSREVPTVVTVHDLTHLHYYSRYHAVYYNVILRSYYRSTSEIVCVSDYTRNEFLHWSGMDSHRVTTIHNSVSDNFSREESAELRLAFDYVLYPGNHRENKNTERLVLAFARSLLPKQGLRLVFTGSVNRKLVTLATKLNVQDQLHFTGFVSDDEIVDLYQQATLIAYVSLYEGFGLPILEAMAAKVPVLTSNVAAMPEVAGNAAYLVDPYSVDAISEGLNSLAFNRQLRKEQIRLGLARVKDFSWDKAAARLWDVVERALVVSSRHYS